MAQRHSLPTSFLDSAHCVAAIDALFALYRKERGRGATIELFCSSYRDTHSLILYAEPGDEEQVEWFKTKLAALYP